ncbi:TPA: CDP-alcohol phosphatidyltransferase family protein, partial [Shigella boydii]|nr:CDP-alcohol phosphatidyltransferase family protein [Shigella boydii]HBI8302952.1 CDP-alcohol phosphatidyltransferase family protein [Shigella boydii]HCR7069665.1 CDP-alcohol phosphatidyltransferase family protein [Shigella boydii]
KTLSISWSHYPILLLWTAINRCRSVLFMSAER